MEVVACGLTNSFLLKGNISLVLKFFVASRYSCTGLPKAKPGCLNCSGTAPNDEVRKKPCFFKYFEYSALKSPRRASAPQGQGNFFLFRIGVVCCIHHILNELRTVWTITRIYGFDANADIITVFGYSVGNHRYCMVVFVYSLKDPNAIPITYFL